MPLSPHEAATMLGVPFAADDVEIDAAVTRRRDEYGRQIERAVTPEIATYWRGQLARLDEARGSLSRAATERRASAEAVADAVTEPATADLVAEPIDRATWSPGVADDAERRRHGLPWETGSGTPVQRSIATVGMLLVDPSAAFARMRRVGGLAEAFRFAMLTGIPPTVLSFYAYFVLQVAFNPAEFGGASLRDVALAGLVIAPVYVAVVEPLSLFLNAGLLHLAVVAVAGAPRPFETTFRASAYAYGAAAFLRWIPLAGVFASIIVQVVLTIVGLARAHEIPTSRAVVAYFLPVLVCGGILLALLSLGSAVGSALALRI